MDTKFLVISESEDDNYTRIVKCENKYRVKDAIKELIEEGQDAKQMIVVDVRRISKVKIEVSKLDIKF